MLLNKHVIVYEYVLCCLLPAATLKDNISHTNKMSMNDSFQDTCRYLRGY